MVVEYEFVSTYAIGTQAKRNKDMLCHGLRRIDGESMEKLSRLAVDNLILRLHVHYLAISSSPA